MKKIVVDLEGGKCRTALLDDGKLIELLTDDSNNASEAGNIYLARIKNILPSQFVFLDIGKEKAAFMHLSDSKGANKRIPKAGQDLIVQVIRDASGTKGPSVTTQLSFTGRYAVILRNDSHEQRIGVSQKITDETERSRLRKIAEDILPEEYAIIIRTQALNISANELHTEIDALVQKFKSLEKKAVFMKSPVLLSEGGDLLFKGFKELLSQETEKIIVNSLDTAHHIKNELKTLHLDSKCTVEIYEEISRLHILDFYDINAQAEKALQPKVWLKSGGFIVIEQTEAAVVIDVNTGKFAGKKDHGETVFKTNMEAAAEIAYQLRLRNLSGIIIIDFINMKPEEDKIRLSEFFTQRLHSDRLSVSVTGMIPQELFLLTRKKVREPLANMLTTQCGLCFGSGRVKNRDKDKYF